MVVALAACGGDPGRGAATDAPVDGAPTATFPAATTPPPAPSPTVATSSARLDDLRLDEAPAPVALRIDRIGVDAPVTPVGVDDAGDFDVPAADVVGWYRYGPSPGEAGSAVLAGHVDYGGEVGVFFDLDELVPGDAVSIAYADGSEQAFTVTAVERYDKDELPDELFDRDGGPSLALITCGGPFDPERRTYLDNVVVRAEPAP